MIHSNNIRDKMESVEMIQNENKKAWITPELESMDSRKTYGGWDPAPTEEFEDDPEKAS